MTSPSRAVEAAFFFKVMSNLASAKERGSVKAVADSIADLEMMVMHSEAPSIVQRATVEIERASAVLTELQTKRFGVTGPVLALAGAGSAANIN